MTQPILAKKFFVAGSVYETNKHVHVRYVILTGRFILDLMTGGIMTELTLT